VHEGGGGVVGEEGLEHRPGRHRGGERHRAAGQRLGQAQDVGDDPRLLAGEQGAGAAEPGKNLVDDEGQAVGAGEARHLGQHLGGVHPHAAGPLDQGLDDHRRQGVLVVGEAGLEGRDPFGAGGQVAKHLGRQGGAEAPVHALFRIADRHRPEGVAVVAAAKGEEAGAPRNPPVEPELKGHLQRDLDGHRPGIRKEHVVEVARQQGGEAGGQPLRRRVGEAAEHHVRHGLQLGGDGGPDVGMVVAMRRRPPRGDAVDELAPIRQHDARPVRPQSREGRGGGLHLRVGPPEVIFWGVGHGGGMGGGGGGVKVGVGRCVFGGRPRPKI